MIAGTVHLVLKVYLFTCALVPISSTGLQLYIFDLDYRITSPLSGRVPAVCHVVLPAATNSAKSIAATVTSNSNTVITTAAKSSGGAPSSPFVEVTTKSRGGIDAHVDYPQGVRECAVVSAVQRGSNRNLKPQRIVITDLNNNCSITHLHKHLLDVSRDHDQFFCTKRLTMVTQGGNYMVQTTDDNGHVQTTQLHTLPPKYTSNPGSIENWFPYVILQKITTPESGSVAVLFEQPPNVWFGDSITTYTVELKQTGDLYGQIITVENDHNDYESVTFTQVHHGLQYQVTLIADLRSGGSTVIGKSVVFDCIGNKLCLEIMPSNEHYCKGVDLKPQQCSSLVPSSHPQSFKDKRKSSSTVTTISLIIIALSLFLTIFAITVIIWFKHRVKRLHGALLGHSLSNIRNLRLPSEVVHELNCNTQWSAPKLIYDFNAKSIEEDMLQLNGITN